MTPVEILTLVPLGVLVVVFGIQPGLLLDLVQGTVVATLAESRPATSIAIPAEVVAVLLGLIAARRRRADRLRAGVAAARADRSRRWGRPLSLRPDLTIIGPLVAAILTACAVLVADLIRPASKPLALAVAYIGLAITAALTVSVGQTPGARSAARTRSTALTTFLDILFISIVALTIAFAPDYLMPRGLPMPGVRDHPRVRDDRRDAHRRVDRAPAAVHRPRADGAARATCWPATTRPTRTRPRARSSTSCWARSARRSSCSGWRSSGA